MASIINSDTRQRRSVTAPRRLSAPRERTLTELGLREALGERHENLNEWECHRIRCATHDKSIDLECGD